jgi:hypothetical protein
MFGQLKREASRPKIFSVFIFYLYMLVLLSINFVKSKIVLNLARTT